MWDQLVSAWFKLWLILRQMQRRGVRGPIRTKLVAEFPGGEVEEFPFFTFTV